MSLAWYETTLTVEVAFGYGPYDASPVWTDITEYVRPDLNTVRGRTSEFTQYSPGTGILVLDNRERRFDPEHAAGPYFGDLNPMVPVRITSTYGVTTYPIFRGFVQGWPQQIGKGYTDATVRVSLIDATRLLQQAGLLGCPFRNTVINDGAAHYWPLQETPSDGALFLDELDTGLDLSIQPVNPLTGGTPFPIVSSTFSTTDLQFPIGRQRAPRLRLYDLGASSYISDYITGPPDDSVTCYGLEFWGRIAITSDVDRIDVAYSGSSDNYIGVVIDQTGLSVTFRDAVANLGYEGLLSAADYSGVHHFAVWVDGTDIIGYVDGQEIGRETLTTAIGVSQTPLLNIRQGMTADDPESTNVSNVAVYEDGTEPDWFEHFLAGSTGYGHPVGERTGQRIGRWLDEIGWPSANRDLSTGETVVGAYDTASSLLSAARELERVEQGLFFVARDGDVTFRDRQWQWAQVPLGTFGDDPSDLQFRDIRPDANTVEAIRNEVSVTWAGGDVTVRDVTSRDAYGLGEDSISSRMIPAQVTAQNLAAYIVRIGKDPRTRITFLRVMPRRDPSSLFPVILGLDLGSILSIDVRPLNVGSATTYDVAVQGIQHRISRAEWVTDIYLAPSDTGPYFVVGDATKGRIGVTADNRIPY